MENQAGEGDKVKGEKLFDVRLPAVLSLPVVIYESERPFVWVA